MAGGESILFRHLIVVALKIGLRFQGQSQRYFLTKREKETGLKNNAAALIRQPSEPKKIITFNAYFKLLMFFEVNFL